MGEGLPLGDLAPDGHYLKEFFKRNDETYRQDANTIANIYFRNIDQSTPENQALMLIARQTSLQSEHLSESNSPEIHWQNSLVAFAKSGDNAAAVIVVDGYEVI